MRCILDWFVFALLDINIFLALMTCPCPLFLPKQLFVQFYVALCACEREREFFFSTYQNLEPWMAVKIYSQLKLFLFFKFIGETYEKCMYTKNLR